MADTSYNGKTVYTLTQVAQSIQSMIARTYIGRYYIKAEMVRLNHQPRNGHCYPELVDKEGDVIKTEMRAVIWSSDFIRINDKFQKITAEPLKDGITILCLAAVTFTPRYGLALQIQDVEPAYTLGEMAKNRLETIARLKQENAFDANKKLKMPLLPQRIAVISVETSKGYNDFMVTLKGNKHGYRFHTELFPSLLQGDRAVATMTNQLLQIAKRKDDFDCVVIIRGGGGDVGLNCYDQYELAQRVATFPIPVLSGIGHSTNETVTEMVSFGNKITPTEVAYYLIGFFEDFENKIANIQSFISEKTLSILKDEKNTLSQLESQIELSAQKIFARENHQLLELQSSMHLSAHKILESNKQGLSDCRAVVGDGARSMLSRENILISSFFTKLQLSVKQNITNKRNELRYMDEKLQIMHPSNILKRGFSITYHNGKAITDCNQVVEGQEVETIVLNGSFKSVVK